jgi:outer membrane cobalamin receptor
LAWGKFRQTAKNEWLKLNTSLQGEKADHYILNYQRIENNKTFRVETYYKKYDDLVKVENGVVTNNGSGYAKGVELFWRDNESVNNLDYWISYSFLDTKRDYLNFPGKATPGFASKHNFSVVGKYFVVKLKSQLSSTFSYTSGRPYNNPNETVFNGSKTPSYQDLSFTWSYLPKPYLIVFFSCTNVLGRDNVFGYEYGSTLNEQGMYNSRAIRQPAPRFVFLGIFLTLSKDKSVNQLPTL